MKTDAIVLWFTGLSGSGKTTLASLLNSELTRRQLKVSLLDGDVIRSLHPNRGYSKEDRIEHNRLLVDRINLFVNFDFVIVATIAPFEIIRMYARENLVKYFEIYLNTPLEVCQKRDPKGLYARAQNGLIKDFTGFDQPYETPRRPHLTLNTSLMTESLCINEILEKLIQLKYITPHG